MDNADLDACFKCWRIFLAGLRRYFNVENALNWLTTCCVVVIYIHEFEKLTFKPYQNHIPLFLLFFG